MRNVSQQYSLFKVQNWYIDIYVCTAIYLHILPMFQASAYAYQQAFFGNSCHNLGIYFVGNRSHRYRVLRKLILRCICLEEGARFLEG